MATLFKDLKLVSFYEDIAMYHTQIERPHLVLQLTPKMPFKICPKYSTFCSKASNINQCSAVP